MDLYSDGEPWNRLPGLPATAAGTVLCVQCAHDRERAHCHPGCGDIPRRAKSLLWNGDSTYAKSAGATGRPRQNPRASTGTRCGSGVRERFTAAGHFDLLYSRLREESRFYTQAFLDACLEEYINFKKETRSATSESTLLAIDAQLLVLEDKIETGENAIVEFQKRNNLVFIQEQGSTAGSSLARQKKRLAALKSKFRELVSLSLEQHLGGENWSGEQDELVRVSVLQTSDNYKEAKLQYDRLIAERDGFSIYLKPKHPKMINFGLEIERAQNMRNIYRKQGLEQPEEQKSVLPNPNCKPHRGDWGVGTDFSGL